MVIKLVLSKKFEKKLKSKIPNRDKILDTIKLLSENPFNPVLRTHKLSGNLSELYACICGYDCRIIFHTIQNQDEMHILLIDIGTHDEVY